MEYKIGEEIELEQINIILQIPKNTAKLKIEAVIVDDDNQAHIVTRTLSTQEVFDARKDFTDWVDEEEYGAVYTLTDSGREYLDSMENGDVDAKQV